MNGPTKGHAMGNYFKNLRKALREKQEREANNSVKRHAHALNVARRLLYAFRHGQSVPASYFLSLEVGNDYEILPDLLEIPNGGQVIMRVIESTQYIVVVTGQYPPGARLGEHYHPDAVERIACNVGAAVIIIQDADGGEERLHLPDDGISEIQPYVIHSVEADPKLGCSLTVTLTITPSLPI